MTETATELGGIAVHVTPTGRVVAAQFESGRILGDPGASMTGTEDLRRLGELASRVPAVTDCGKRADERLRAAGAREPLIWDVLELATLMVAACPRDSLDRAADFFGICAETAAERLVLLFDLLVTMLEQVETHTLLHVIRLAAGLDWPLSRLFQQVLDRRGVSRLESGPLAEAAPIGAWITRGAVSHRRRAPPDNAHSATVRAIDLDHICRSFAPDGALAAALEAYEPRQEQVQMARHVGEALNEGGQVVVEAGTGIGKSLAYLVPAVHHSVLNDQRVVVSTATTTLQDQLFEHDLPLVERTLDEQRTLRASVLKGRTNYLCLRRWQLLLQSGDLSTADRMLLIKTLFWLPRTATGDRAELMLSPAEEEAWQRVAAVAEACTPVRCPYHRIGVCFLARARRAAEESHVVITNHALLLSDLANRSRVLPDYETLVVDEAHHLEEEATQQLGWRLGEREPQARLERLSGSGLAAAGLVPEAMARVAAAGQVARVAAVAPTLEAGQSAVVALGAAIRRLFDGLLAALDDPELLAAGGDETTLRITAAVRAGSAWQELEHVWSDALEHFAALERMIVEVVAELEGLPEKDEVVQDLGGELAGQLDYWRDLRRRLQACVHQPSGSVVYWISGGGRVRAAWLNAAPIDVSGLLRDRLFAQRDTSVLVSATLSIGGSFAYVKRRLGLEDAAAHALGSPFDYARAALLYVPNDMPDPTQAGYQVLLERTIIDIISRLRGRTLVLFTNRAQLRATYHAVRQPLAAARVTLMAQAIDESSRTRLLDRFRHGARVALFGTNAFWEGIDVVGEALSCVILTRLPFAVPTDPVYAARAEQFDDPFSEYAVPQAVLRLKQGFGRLIRSRTDRGAVVVLDRRIVTRFYGQVFLRSLPPCSLKQGPAARAGAEVLDWLTPQAEQQMLLGLARG
jgi:DNA polymerase-3 subunit epsilon/ATP-dependent DNA helicase DinG